MVNDRKPRITAEKIVCAVCFALVIGVQLWYLFPMNEVLKGHDWIYHYLRVDAVADRLRHLDFLSEINYVFFGGAGYADFAYPILFLYIPALFRVLGCGVGLSMSLFLLVCAVATYCSMYHCVKSITGSAAAGTLAAAVYSLAQYRLDCVYTRFALGEVQAFVFWPIVLLGMYDLIARDFKKPWILGIGVGGMLLAHSLSAALAVMMCGVLFLVFIRRIVTDKAKLIRLAVTAAVTMGATAAYWMPMLHLTTSCDLTLFHPNTRAADNTVSIFAIFGDMELEAKRAGIGLTVLGIVLSRFVLFTRSPLSEKLRAERNQFVFFDVLLIVGTVLLYFVTDAAPWGVIGVVFNFLNLAWRLYAVTTVCYVVAGAVFADQIFRYANARKVGAAMISVVCCVAALVHFNTIAPTHVGDRGTNYFYESKSNRAVCYGEWMPWAAHETWDDWQDTLDDLTLSSGEKIDYTRERSTLVFRVDSPCAYADVPYLYYKGYRAYTAYGEQLSVEMNEQGFVRVWLDGATGEIVVRYALSGVTIASYCISTATLTGLAVFAVTHRKKRRQDGM